MAGGVATVSSMAACNTAAGLDSGTSVHFGAHPTLTRVVHLWAGRRRWRPQRRKLKQIVFRKRRDEGKRICDDRVEKQDFQVIASGTSLIEWRDIRKIRASFLTNAQTLYRLKSNRFPLWNWASQDLSCPYPACSTSLPAMASHISWNCPSARRHWDYLLERWRQLGDLKETDLHVWVFRMDLPSISTSAWYAIKNAIDFGANLFRAKDAVFPAARELWRFLVSTTLHSIWAERLRRLEDSLLSQEVHNARARHNFDERLLAFEAQHTSRTWG
ncbi:hypothetical protein KXD40_001485 [Peronospora effusa]|nr:hypothetical protein KXD40_001485 [Peronospora effusa]